MLKNWERVCPRAMEIVTAAAQKRVEAAAQERCEQAKARAPVKTGALRKSIAVRAGVLTAAVGTDCPYAAAVEFGGKSRAPQPFMGG